ncbi:MAG: cold-shock protein [Thermoplasmata archaeon]|nr:cold-shock protein [Thermoplasmata archaeon]
MEGTVKWYNGVKSFGFIQIEEGKDVFVHQSALEEGASLNEGDKVSFDVEQGDKGPHAVNVKKL